MATIADNPNDTVIGTPKTNNIANVRNSATMTKGFSGWPAKSGIFQDEAWKMLRVTGLRPTIPTSNPEHEHEAFKI